MLNCEVQQSNSDEENMLLLPSLKKSKDSTIPVLSIVKDQNKRGKVSIIDDDFATQVYLRSLLEKNEYEVSSYGSAEEFLFDLSNIKRRDGEIVDVILADIYLPGSPGHSLLGRLAELDIKIPVILMTAFAELENAVRAMKQGAYDYIEKPFGSERLISTLEAAIKSKLNVDN